MFRKAILFSAVVFLSFLFAGKLFSMVQNNNFTVGIWWGSSTVTTIDSMKNLGISLFRVRDVWELCESEKGKYDMKLAQDLNDRILAARKNGIKILLLISNSPAWSRTSGDIQAMPDNPDYLKSWLNYRLTRNLNGKPFYDYIDAIQIGNEVEYHNPNTRESLIRYVNLLKVAKAVVNQLTAKIMIITGLRFGYNPEFDINLENLYTLNAEKYFDGIGFHVDDPPHQPYYVGADSTTKPYRYLESHIRSVEKILNSHEDSKKKIWITELGFSTQMCRVSSISGNILTIAKKVDMGFLTKGMKVSLVHAIGENRLIYDLGYIEKIDGRNVVVSKIISQSIVTNNVFIIPSQRISSYYVPDSFTCGSDTNYFASFLTQSLSILSKFKNIQTVVLHFWKDFPDKKYGGMGIIGSNNEDKAYTDVKLTLAKIKLTK